MKHLYSFSASVRCEAMFTLLSFHFYPFLQTKMLPVHIALFSKIRVIVTISRLFAILKYNVI